MQELFEKIRVIPLPERIEMAKQMIRSMCAEGRYPKMSVPAQSTDEDIFIIQTLTDLGEYYNQTIGLVISHFPHQQKNA